MDRLSSLLAAALKEGLISHKLKEQILDIYHHYLKTFAASSNQETIQRSFETLIEKVLENIQNPHHFSIFHRAVQSPFDYYQFGLDFIRPFIDFNQSKMTGIDSIRQIEKQIGQKENVILFANHQTEPDPQIISLLLEKIAPKLALDMIFVAGHRVITDPMAIPMSLGRNLLCIYSKKHMTGTSEEKSRKISHNQKTLKKLQELLNEGGNCIYVAPSGGRDRPNAKGELQVDPFDPQSIELFRLMGEQAVKKTHFYPLALLTYPLMPPPKEIEKELGEKRIFNITPVFLGFGKEIDFEHFLQNPPAEKKARRQKTAELIEQQVIDIYNSFLGRVINS